MQYTETTTKSVVYNLEDLLNWAKMFASKTFGIAPEDLLNTDINIKPEDIKNIEITVSHSKTSGTKKQ